MQGRPIGEAYSGYDDRSSLPIGLSPTLNYVAYAVCRLCRVRSLRCKGCMRVEYQQRIAAGELSMIKKHLKAHSIRVTVMLVVVS